MKATRLVPMLGLAIGLCSAFTSRANAQCWGKLVQQQGSRAFTQQARDERHTGQAAQPQEQSAQAQQEDTVHPQGPAPTIVGLWDMQVIIDGQVVDAGFDQFHADGNEVLNDTPPPATGAVCLGVYAQTGKRTF